jgi:hypothetical protein
MGDMTTFESIVQLSEIIGLPIQLNGQKAYLFGQFLIGDIFQVWGKTITAWTTQSEQSSPTWPPIPSISLNYFYGITVIAGVVLLWINFLFIKGIYKDKRIPEALL